ncbi:MAG: hypothetical protein M3384_11150 [Acidobacteriota bacterium]|nr:hypothetical protein [Acidobacteriota bacterium]
MLDYEWHSPVYVVTLIIYFLSSSIEIFDIRLIQYRRTGQDFGELPRWVGIFYVIVWISFAALLVMNWKAALIAFAIRFILKVLPVRKVNRTYA